MWNLTIDVSPHRRIHKAEYRCHKGYLLDADEERRRCSPEGLFDSKDQYIQPNEWSGREPKCLLIGKNKVERTTLPAKSILLVNSSN